MATARTYCVIILQMITYFGVIIRASEPVNPPPNGMISASSKLHPEIPRIPILPRSFPCPEPDTIQPCTCSVTELYEVNIDCSDVTSEDELKSIFSQTFTFNDFTTLTITGNQNLRVFKIGDLGTRANFVNIKITEGVLEIIDFGSLSASYGTLKSLILWSNRLQSIPDIIIFTKLEILNAYNNAFYKLPVFTPTSPLLSLDFSFNQIQSINPTDFDGVLHLETLSLFGNPLPVIPAGTFDKLTNLTYLGLGFTDLTTLPANSIKLTATSTSLYLQGSKITDLPVGSFSGITSLMDVSDNLLTKLDQLVWEPLLQVNVELYLKGNPFGCGCDMKWLIVDNPELQASVADKATCKNGTAFYDLNPEIYRQFCP